MVKVALDVMGGDYGPGEIINGALAALNDIANLHLNLVGIEEEIEAQLGGVDYPSERLTVHHAPEVIHCHDDPGLSIRSKKNSSMVKALQMVRSGDAEVALSVGNTGALMAGGVLFLGRLKGINRPALLTSMPSFSGQPVLFLDVGANMDARPQQLLQYAFMGRIYAQQLLGCSEPRIALLNVGIEPNKGNSLIKKTYALFHTHLPGFCGNIEGTQAFFGKADVVVCDGFVGNIFLKTSEGLSRAILGFFRQEIPTSFRYKLGALLLQPVFLNLREKIDDSGYGGAPLLGVKGLCIKCHGSARARSIEQALKKQAVPFIRKKVAAQFQDALEELSDQLGEREEHE